MTKRFVMIIALIALAFSAISAKSGFEMWQLPSQVNTIGNSYVLRTDKGRVVVIDGGAYDEAPYLREFLKGLGNEVDLWFVSHPHDDHMGALTILLEEPGELKINNIVHSRFSDEHLALEQPYDDYCRRFYKALDNSDVKVTDLHEPGTTFDIDGMHVKILSVTNEEITKNPFNNSSMIMRVWDDDKSIVFLGDAGVECGDKVLNSPYRKDLDCDYLQVAHHGQQGCSKDFYDAVNFGACLWSTPSWVWENNQFTGYNSGVLKTFETRQWIADKGVREHHVTCRDGIWHLK